MSDDQMRAADSDRQRIADRLRLAADEGRLTLSEYDERLAAAFKAQTYAELNALITDLPGPAGEEKSRVAPVESGRDVHRRDRRDRRGRRRRGIRSGWGGWLGLSVFLTGIWFISRLSDISEKGWTEGTQGHGFWPLWPIAGFGLLMLVRTLGTMFDRDGD